MSNFTCITCRVAFADADLQRNHYKTDWHRYNLKRKIAELPPVTADNFKDRVLTQRAQQAELEKDTSSYCQLCRKHFNTKNAFDNHIQSRKHLEMQAKREEEAKAQVQKRNEKNEHKGLDVLEENRKVAEKNLKNLALRDTMLSTEGPTASSTEGPTASTGATSKAKKSATVEEPMEEEELSEEEWDGEALGEEECLFCSKISNSLEANLQHMTQHHSFFIPDIEFLTNVPALVAYLGEKVGEGHICLWCNEKGKAFYTTKSVQQHMVDKGHCKMFFDGDAVLEYSDFYDYRSSYPGFEESGGRGDAEGAVGGVGEEKEDEVSSDMMNEDNYQLVLPSGSTIGHRSLQRYYRQKLKPGREVHSTAVSKVIAQYRALGWTGTKGPDAQRRAKDLAYVQRLRLRQNMQIGMRGNTILAKHFRDQVFGIRH